MKKPCVGLVLASAFLASTALADQPAPASGVELGLRTGYALPMGDAAKDAKMSDGISGMIPIWLDVGYRINPNIYAGVYGQYGIVSVKDCRDGVSCSANDIRFGLNAHYHISPGESMDPWVGFGIGYEMFSNKQSANGVDVTTTYKGFEFANLQGGLDFNVASGLNVGPFLSFSMGQYSSQSMDPESPLFPNGSVENKAMHEWLTLGIRGTYGL